MANKWSFYFLVNFQIRQNFISLDQNLYYYYFTLFMSNEFVMYDEISMYSDLICQNNWFKQMNKKSLWIGFLSTKCRKQSHMIFILFFQFEALWFDDITKNRSFFLKNAGKPSSSITVKIVFFYLFLFFAISAYLFWHS